MVPPTPKAVKERRYVPLVQPSSSTIGNIELHHHSSDTDYAELLRRSRGSLQSVLGENVTFVLRECLVEELLTGREYIWLKGLIGGTPERQVRELINTILYKGTAKDFLKLLATPDVQINIPGLDLVIPPEPTPLHVSLGVEKARDLPSRAMDTSVNVPIKEEDEKARTPKRKAEQDSEHYKRKVEALMKAFIEEEAGLGALAKIKLSKDGLQEGESVEDELKRIIEASFGKNFLKIMIERNKGDTPLEEIVDFFLRHNIEADVVKIMRLLYTITTENDGEMEEGDAALAVKSGECRISVKRLVSPPHHDENDGEKKEGGAMLAVKSISVKREVSPLRHDENDGKMEERDAIVAVKSSRCCHCTCDDVGNDGKRKKKEEPFFTLENPCICGCSPPFAEVDNPDACAEYFPCCNGRPKPYPVYVPDSPESPDCPDYSYASEHFIDCSQIY